MQRGYSPTGNVAATVENAEGDERGHQGVGKRVALSCSMLIGASELFPEIGDRVHAVLSLKEKTWGSLCERQMEAGNHP